MFDRNVRLVRQLTWSSLHLPVLEDLLDHLRVHLARRGLLLPVRVVRVERGPPGVLGETVAHRGLLDLPLRLLPGVAAAAVAAALLQGERDFLLLQDLRQGRRHRPGPVVPVVQVG